MPSSRNSFRLLVAASTAIGATAIAGLAPTPAHAAPLTDGYLEMDDSLNFNGGNCTVTPGPSDIDATFTAGTTVKRTRSFDQTATAADPTDSVRMRGTQTTAISSTSSNGQLTSLRVNSTTTGSIRATKSTTVCDQAGFPASVSATSYVEANVQRTSAGWLRIRATSTGVGGQIMGVAFGSQDLVGAEVFTVSVRDQSQDTWVYVPAGSHPLSLQVGGVAVNGLGLSTVSLKQSVTFTFAPAGIARAATSGTARSKVVLPQRLTCSSGKAVTSLTAKVRGASRATFYVNGTKKASYARPRARQVVLSGVPKNRAVTLKVVIKDGRRTQTATRSYRSC